MNKLIALTFGILLLATPVFAQNIPGLAEIERLGFPDILLWLLTFAVVYGVLTQVKVPQSNAARAIIAIVTGFLVLLAAPAQLESVLSQVSANLILVVLAILALIVFLEVAGVKTRGKMYFDKEGKRIYEHDNPISYLEYHGKIAAAVIILIVIVIFVGAGGLSLIGLPNIPQINTTGSFFFIVIIIAVIWMIAESSGGKK